MAKKLKTTNKLAGIALIVIGAGLAFWGYQKSGGLGSQLSKAITGSHSDSVMALYIGGAACLAIGILLSKKK